MARSYHGRGEVHRVLKVRKDPLRGDDVKRIQRAANRRLRARGLDRYAVKVDGVYGPKTARACLKALWALGYVRSGFRATGVRRGGRISRRAQRAIKLKRKRNARQLRRAEKRLDGEGTWRPRIVRLEVHYEQKFGALGPEFYVTGHHTAGPMDKNLEDALRLARSYHAHHANKGWGGIGYHVMFARDGTIILLRPVYMKGAHTGGANSGNVGATMNGTTGDKPTPEQARAFRWWLANAHTDRVPKSHRTDRSLTAANLRGHNDWQGHTWNACPGTHRELYVSGGRRR